MECTNLVESEEEKKMSDRVPSFMNFMVRGDRQSESSGIKSFK